jgi:hypothetical protein
VHLWWPWVGDAPAGKRNRTASARTSDPGASIGRVPRPHDSDEGAYQPSISLRGVVMLRTTFAMLRTVVLATFKEYMLRACCERVVSMLRTRLRATSNIRSLSPLPPCCDYITNMLRPVLRATSNIKSSPLFPPQHKTQHHTSATSKLNIRNICQITVKH